MQVPRCVVPFAQDNCRPSRRRGKCLDAEKSVHLAHIFVALLIVKNLPRDQWRLARKCLKLPNLVVLDSVGSRERQRGEGIRAGRGGGGNLMRRPPYGKQFLTPLTLVRFAPPFSICLIKSLRKSQIFPQVTPQKQLSEGIQK